MNYFGAAIRGFALPFRLLPAATSLLACLTFLGASLPGAETGTGSISGSVSSAETRNALQGAVVSIPSLNRSEFSDSAGSFVLSKLPPGVVELVISYAGFEEQRQSVTIRAGEPTRFDVAMKPAQTVVMATK